MMAKCCFPLMLKTFVRIQPPLQWKGGNLVELFKSKGSPSCCKNYRDILLADDSGKAIGKLVRKRLLPVAVGLSHDSQFGSGFHGGETAFAQMYVRLVVDSAVNLSISCGTSYLDVVAAFATLLRRIIFNVEEGDEQWLLSLKHAGFEDHDIRAIYDHVCDHSWIDNVLSSISSSDPCDPALIDFNMMEQLYTNSWVSQDFIPNVLNIINGGSAGTPLADLVYGLCMARVLTLLRSTLNADNLTSSIVSSGKCYDVKDVSYVDDVAMPVTATANDLVGKIAAIANCAYRVFPSFGMSLNFNPGESECTVGFFGNGSRAASTSLAKANHKIPISAGDFSCLNVVKCYQHVGTLSPISCNPNEEVTKRKGINITAALRLIGSLVI